MPKDLFNEGSLRGNPDPNGETIIIFEGHILVQKCGTVKVNNISNTEVVTLKIAFESGRAWVGQEKPVYSG
jgi:hypothetical protein